MPNDTVLSPGKVYHAHVKHKYPRLGNVALDDFITYAVPYYQEHYKVSHCQLPPSGWLAATTYVSKGNEDPWTKGVLVLWIKPNGVLVDPMHDTVGWVFDDVPSYVVGMLHGFGRKQVPREYTSDELIDLLTKSIEKKAEVAEVDKWSLAQSKLQYQ